MPMYKYYQLVGGTEQWTPVKAEADLSGVRPTFTTVLTLDTLIESEPDRETLERVRYLGPCYFDIDSEDLSESIASAQELFSKLTSHGLSSHDIEIYLSGKKGLHLIVPPICFLEKPDEPVARLPAIYKEIAFKFAVPCLDFKVYTARKGRMLRTCYNQRENGLYKVPISEQELGTLTPELYAEIASAPRRAPLQRPAFSPRFSLVYAAAAQKVANFKPRKTKPPTAEVLRRDLVHVNKLLRGDVKQSFNKIALQLAIYAREVRWSEDQLVQAAAGLINNHESDSARYGSPGRRVAEIRRMCQYVDDNGGYIYSSNVLRAFCGGGPAAIEAPGQQEEAPEGTPEAEAEPVPESNVLSNEYQAVRVSVDGIFADDGESSKRLSHASLGRVSIAHVVNGEIEGFRADIYIDGQLKFKSVDLHSDTFSGSAALHKELARYGTGFMGNDLQARAVLAALQTSDVPAVTSLQHAGLDLVVMPNSQHEVLTKGVLVWASPNGTVAPAWATPIVSFSFKRQDAHQELPDVMLNPHPSEFFSNPDNVDMLEMVWDNLWKSNNPNVIATLYGWTTACFYKSLIQAATDQFPLLHIAGPAGSGKTANAKLAFQMHSHGGIELPETTPQSTAFALSQLLSCYSSAPIMLDEYKPSRMVDGKVEAFRALFRDAYNGKGSLRGGGGGVGSGVSYKKLDKTNLKAPLVFVSESLETETAIVERSIPLTISKNRGRNTSTFQAFMQVKDHKHVLGVLGRGIVEQILARESVKDVRDKLRKLSNELRVEATTPQPDDVPDIARARRNINERPLHNLTVIRFGFDTLWAAVTSILGSHRMQRYEHYYGLAVTQLNEQLLNTSKLAVPELIKALQELFDLARTDSSILAKTMEGVVAGGTEYLALDVRAVFGQYRMYCRQRGLPGYYSSAEAWEHAVMNFQGYQGMSAGTGGAQHHLLMYKELTEAGLTPWPGRFIRK
jgi:hypothetical protein